MNRLLKSVLCIAFCFASVIPAVAKVEVEKTSYGYLARNENVVFYSKERLTSASDIRKRERVVSGTDSEKVELNEVGQSAICIYPFAATFMDEMELRLAFFCNEALVAEMNSNKTMTLKFANGKSAEINFVEYLDEDWSAGMVAEFSCMDEIDDDDDDYVDLLDLFFWEGLFDYTWSDLNRDMILYATSDITSVTCGNLTYHITGQTAPYIKSLFSALIDKLTESERKNYSSYLAAVQSGGSTSYASSPSGPVSSGTVNMPKFKDTYTADRTATGMSALLKNPAGYAGRSPFTSPGIYQPEFEKYASQNSLHCRTAKNGTNQTLIFANGVVKESLGGYPCKFVANFKNQILNSYLYQSNVPDRTQAVELARKLASELAGMGCDKSSGYKKVGDALFGEQYLYGAGTRVIVDARQSGSHYSVSLIVSVTHF